MAFDLQLIFNCFAKGKNSQGQLMVIASMRLYFCYIYSLDMNVLNVEAEKIQNVCIAQNMFPEERKRFLK